MTIYWWGDEPFEMKVIPHCFVGGALINIAALYFATQYDLCCPGGKCEKNGYAGVVLVTLLWIHFYYNAISAQISVKGEVKEA